MSLSESTTVYLCLVHGIHSMLLKKEELLNNSNMLVKMCRALLAA